MKNITMMKKDVSILKSFDTSIFTFYRKEALTAHGNAYDLDDLYKSYSIYKARAFDDCVKVESELGGYDRQLCGNYMTFTFSFKFDYEGKNYQAKITKDNAYFCEID